MGIAIHPSGRFAYAVNQTGRSLSQYAVGAGGTLTPLSPATVTVTTVGGPTGIVAEPSGRFVFVSVSNAIVAPFAVAADGTLSPLSPATVPTGMSPNSIAVLPWSGALFVGNSSNNNLSQYSLGAAGALTALSPATVATGMFPVSLAIDPAGRWLYSANANSSDVGQFSVGATGALTPLNPARVVTGTVGTNNPTWVTVDPSGRYAYVSDSVDPAGVVWQFTIGVTGGLTPMSPPSVPAGIGPMFIAIAGRYQ